jgi:hypothetical protein
VLYTLFLNGEDFNCTDSGLHFFGENYDRVFGGRQTGKPLELMVSTENVTFLKALHAVCINTQSRVLAYLS